MQHHLCIFLGVLDFDNLKNFIGIFTILNDPSIFLISDILLLVDATMLIAQKLSIEPGGKKIKGYFIASKN